MKRNRNHIKIVKTTNPVSVFVALAIGLLAGYIFGHFVFKPSLGFSDRQNKTGQLADAQYKTQSVRQSGYKYINPLLECEYSSQIQDKDLESLKYSAAKEIDKILKDKKVDLISVYFRDLNNGPWFGINENEDFAPASLLKVPTMMAIYKIAEDDPRIFGLETVYEEENLTENSFKIPEEYLPEERLIPGNSYTVFELMDRMIIYSDNAPFRLLLGVVDPELLKQIHTDLGLIYPDENTPDNFVSVKQYASLFRVLFNSSYLNRKYSEEALTVLSNSVFKEGIVAGVKGDTEVSHKFGIWVDDNNQNNVQLHDCGIIYYPEHPYLLCIMTKGGNLDDLSGSIESLSGVVFDEIDMRYKE